MTATLKASSVLRAVALFGVISFLGAVEARPTLAMQAGQSLPPDEAQALDRAVTEALGADQVPDSTIAHISERIKRWSFVLVRAPQGSNDFKLAQGALARAQQDLKVARTKALQDGNIDNATRQVIAARLASAKDAIRARDWVQAEQEIQSVLDQSPNYPVALSLLDELQREKRLADNKRLLVIALLGTIVVIGLGFFIARFGKRVQRGHGAAARLAAPKVATLRIVDGVGEGKQATIGADRPVFRLGAAMGQVQSEQNDLVISDSGAFVSRFHCSLVREGDRFLLVDSSTNGTALNGKRLERGARVPVSDGDEIAISDVARVRFTLQ